VADDTDQQQKTEEATPRRIEKAREEGQVARSRELTTFIMLLGGVVALWGLSEYLFSATRAIMEQSLIFDVRGATDVKVMLVNTATLLEAGLLALVPLFVFMAALALISPMVLGGFLISISALSPKFSKLNPVKGLQRIFSSQAIAELAKVVAKISLLGGVAATFLSSRLDQFMGLLHQPLDSAAAEMLRLAVEVCGVMVLALVAVILIDVPYQLWSHARQLRMTKEEIKREHKDSEGDPQLKARIRSQQQTMARQRMMSNVPTADVVITNPTHYAVALKYDESSMGAPRVVAKGADAVAQRIRAMAADNEVPLIEAPPVARALYRHVDLEREVPFELYPVIAEIMAWAVNLRRLPASERSNLTAPAGLEVPPEMWVE
jgi:flagellar biosynthetic protein FlhB